MQLDELQRAIQTAQFKALSSTKRCTERAAASAHGSPELEELVRDTRLTQVSETSTR